MNKTLTQTRIEIAFLDPRSERDSASWDVPVHCKGGVESGHPMVPEPAREGRWLTAGQSRYCPEQGTWFRVAPLPIG